MANVSVEPTRAASPKFAVFAVNKNLKLNDLAKLKITHRVQLPASRSRNVYVKRTVGGPVTATRLYFHLK